MSDVTLELDGMVDRIRDSAPKIRESTVEGMRAVARAMSEGNTVSAACAVAGVTDRTYYGWRARYQPFADTTDRWAAAAQETRDLLREDRRMDQKRRDGLVFDPSAEVPPVPTLTQFRWDYFGQPTEPHQESVVAALEDLSNRVVIILGPTGMGKDTIAGQYLLWRTVPTRAGLRGAWFMESEAQSRRRLFRLSRYLVDPSVYRVEPESTPGAQKPTRSLIEDWGPFRWEAGMVHRDGRKVERPPWSSNAMYFLQDIAPEQDPNLWATGVGGATYGSRIQEAVLSDIFTTENQQSPTERKKDLNWVLGTLDTRLDELGRLTVLGTMLPIENNYEAMIAKYTDGARILETKQMGPGTYTKYSNGTAVVIIKAITVDAEGQEQSYWSRFPLDSKLLVGDELIDPDSLTDEERLELTHAKWVEGLRARRRRDRVIFRAMFQQERDTESTGDFTEATFEAALDESRTWEVAYPDELLVVGADPGQYYGAAYAALAVSRDRHTITAVDEFWGNRLGVTGIKRQLVTRPITRWNPIWYCYEVNRHSAILDDALIQQLFRDFGVEVYQHRTTGHNRADHEIGVGSIATYMRARVFRLPAMTAADRERSREVWHHFTAYDQGTLSDGRRRPGSADHQPDDRAFAFWTAMVKARVLLEQNQKSWVGTLAVPQGIRDKWERAKRIADAKAAGQSGRRGSLSEGRNANLADVMMAFVGEE